VIIFALISLGYILGVMGVFSFIPFIPVFPPIPWVGFAMSIPLVIYSGADILREKRAGDILNFIAWVIVLILQILLLSNV
jgi:hypothetical protein